MMSRFARDLKAADMRPSPINAEWIVSGEPQATAAVLAYSNDRATTTMLWHCTAGVFTWRYCFDETIFFLDGEVVISVAGQPPRRYGAGDVVHFSRGAVATWEVSSFIRKVAFCRSVLPQPFGVARRLVRALYRRLRGRGDRLTLAAELS